MQVVQIEKGMGARNEKEIWGVPTKGKEKERGGGKHTEDTHMHGTVTGN